ncbi:hypothetical protein BC829DRAFT_183804 [Chytridium lagenaria]|nr:hypothetical protein BC829DRAFT_183804 [Chytridium lagenaria]
MTLGVITLLFLTLCIETLVLTGFHVFDLVHLKFFVLDSASCAFRRWWMASVSTYLLLLLALSSHHPAVTMLTSTRTLWNGTRRRISER